MDLRNSISIKDTKNKIIFWDLDGTLAPFRFDGKIELPKGDDNILYKEGLKRGLFSNRKPSKHMQKVLASCESKLNILISHYRVDEEPPIKDIWMDKHYPIIKERIYVPLSEPKETYILDYCSQHSIDLNDVLYVDDVLELLKRAEDVNIKSWHISSFLDWFEDN